MSLLNSFFSMLSPASSGVRRVEPAETVQLVRDKKAVLVDVREPAEWAGGVAQKAALLPLSDLAGPRLQWNPFLRQVGDREIILYCHSGSRCGAAARMLVAEGYKVANGGSLRAWHRAGLPICKPKHLR